MPNKITLNSGFYNLSHLVRLINSISSKEKGRTSLYTDFTEGIILFEELFEICPKSKVNIYHSPLEHIKGVIYFYDQFGKEWLRTNDSYAVIFDHLGNLKIFLPIIIISDGKILSLISPYYYNQIKEEKIIKNKKIFEMLTRKENFAIDIEKREIIYCFDIKNRYKAYKRK
jgi:hypothetical protein